MNTAQALALRLNVLPRHCTSRRIFTNCRRAGEVRIVLELGFEQSFQKLAALFDLLEALGTIDCFWFEHLAPANFVRLVICPEGWQHVRHS